MIKCLPHPLLLLLVPFCGTPSASPGSAPGTGAFLHRVRPQLSPRVEAKPASPLSLFLVLPGISPTMYPLLCKSSTACAALLYVAGPV